MRDKRKARCDYRSQKYVDKPNGSSRACDKDKSGGYQRPFVASSRQETHQSAIEAKQGKIRDKSRSGNQRTRPSHVSCTKQSRHYYPKYESKRCLNAGTEHQIQGVADQMIVI